MNQFFLFNFALPEERTMHWIRKLLQLVEKHGEGMTLMYGPFFQKWRQNQINKELRINTSTRKSIPSL